MVTSSSFIRAFFAIDLPQKSKESLAKLITELQKNYPNAIRWTQPKNLHVTLQFLEKIEANKLNTLVYNTREAIKTFPSFALALGTVKLFPSPYRPKIISLDVGPTEPLSQLATLIGNSITTTGYPVDPRPFRGHMTLGRLTQRALHVSTNGSNPIDMTIDRLPPIAVSEIILFRSEPSQDGSHYYPLERFVLPMLK